MRDECARTPVIRADKEKVIFPSRN